MAKSPRSHGNLHPKQYEILPSRMNTPRVLTLSDGRQVKLAKRGATIIRDAGLARAVDQEYGRRARTTSGGAVLVMETDNNHRHEPENRGHCYTFRVPALPWHKYDKDGKRIA